MNTTMFATPRLVAPVGADSVQLAADLARHLTTIVAWGAQVDDEFGLEDEERALWRVLLVIRDTLTEMQHPAAISTSGTSTSGTSTSGTSTSEFTGPRPL